MRPAAPRSPASATPTAACSRRCTRRSTPAYAHTGFFTTEPMEGSPTRWSRARRRLDQVYMVSGGSEAIEAALKLARQYFVEIGAAAAQRLHRRAARAITATRSGALAVGGNAWRRKQFAPLLIDVGHVSPCYEYRDRRDGETPEQYGERLAAELDAKIREIGPEQGDRVRRRDGGRRDAGRGAAGARLLQARARGLRPPRRAADRRRGDVRHGPHRHAARLRAGRRRRPTSWRSPRAWAAATSRSARCWRRAGSSTRFSGAAACSSTATPTSATPAACAGGARGAAASSSATAARPGEGRRARTSPRRLRDALRATTRTSATSAGAGCSWASSWSRTARASAPSTRSCKLHAQRQGARRCSAGSCATPWAAPSTASSGDHVLLAPPFIATRAELDEIVARLAAAIDSGTASLKRAA